MDDTIIYLLQLEAKLHRIENLIEQLQNELVFHKFDMLDPTIKVLDLIGFPPDDDSDDPEGFSRDYFYEIIFEGNQNGESAEIILRKLKDAFRDMKNYRGLDQEDGLAP